MMRIDSQTPPSALHPTADFRSDVVSGLSQQQKVLAPKYFYDKRGSELFDLICSTPEYYPTRTESQILATHAADILRRLPAPISLIELGSGSSMKTRFLFEANAGISSYLPIDISREHLLSSTADLARAFPTISMEPLNADYTTLTALPRQGPRQQATELVFFPGSTIGNLDARESLAILRRIYRLLAGRGYLLIGVDLLKDPEVLERAYNDASGYTAAFNLNLLARINRDLNANFALQDFEHRAFFNSDKRRVEMHLHSKLKQEVTLGSRRFHFQAGESIHTESSYKFDLEVFRFFAQQAGFAWEGSWTDAAQYFGVLLFSCRPGAWF